jgi:glycosyltransferase involved in cell wall biosynthesis
MRILFVEQQPCMRALKYAEGLRNEVPAIQLSFAYRGTTLNGLYGHGDELFDAWLPLGDNPAEQLRTILQTYPVDLIHSHNAPDTLTNLCIDLFGGRIPIVHDIHDMMTIRDTVYEDGFEHEHRQDSIREQERRAIECSDAIIAISDEMVNIARQHYRLPEHLLLFPNYIPRCFIPESVPERAAPPASQPLRIIYEGSLSTNGGHYDMRDIFRAIAQEGIELHIYPSREQVAYRHLAAETPGIVYHDHRQPVELFQEMPQYDAGWCGFNDALNWQHLSTALPNKLFEYIACGLPVISFRHAALQRFIEQYQVGVVIEQVAGLQQLLRSPAMARMRENALEQRSRFTVEANIGQVVALYRALIERAPASLR